MIALLSGIERAASWLIEGAYLVIIVLFLLLPDIDERSIFSDLDLGLLASRLLDLSLVISFTVFGCFRGFAYRSSRKIILDRLLHRRWQVSYRYLLLVFVLIHARIDQGANCPESDDDGDRRYNSSVHFECFSFFFDCDVFRMQ